MFSFLVLGIHTPHVDIFSLLFVLLGLLSLKEDRWLQSFVFIGLAVTVKSSNLIFLLPLTAAALKVSWKKSLYLLVSLTVIGATIYLIDSPRSYLAAILFMAERKGGSIHRLFGFDPVMAGILCALGLVYLGFIVMQYWHSRLDVFELSYLSYIVFVLLTRNAQPWHLLPAYGAQVFFSKLRFDFVGLLLMIGMFCGYYLFGGWTADQGVFSSILITIALLLTLGLETNWRTSSAHVAEA